MAKRKIISIDDEKCNGCGLCIPNCPEGAMQMIDGKARLISDLFCDGLGACIGYCPEGAITIEEREAKPYNEKMVMENIVKQGENTIRAHLEHLKGHGEEEYLNQALEVLKEKGIDNPLKEEKEMTHSHEHGPQGCPGARVMDFGREDSGQADQEADLKSQLRQWPIQLHLVPPHAPYFKNADLAIIADCVPFSYPNAHRDLLKGKAIAIACPKLDDIEAYGEKIAEIIKTNSPKSITVVNMEVPCCFGLQSIVEDAIGRCGKIIPYRQVVVGIKGDIKI